MKSLTTLSNHSDVAYYAFCLDDDQIDYRLFDYLLIYLFI